MERQVFESHKLRPPIFSVYTVSREHPVSRIDMGATMRTITGIRRGDLPLNEGDLIELHRSMNKYHRVKEILERRDARGNWKNPLDAKGSAFTVITELISLEQFYSDAGWEIPKEKKGEKDDKKKGK